MYSLSAVHLYDPYHVHIMSLSDILVHALNQSLHDTLFSAGFRRNNAIAFGLKLEGQMSLKENYHNFKTHSPLK